MFTKDSKTETFLTHMGVDWKYSNATKYVDLMPTWDEHNPARPVIFREDAVMQYASLMEQGSPAPAVIITPTTLGFDVLDGRQRLQAGSLQGYGKFSAYIVQSDDQDTIVAISVLANHRLQGNPEPAEWNKRNAVEVLVIKRGMTPEEVAARGGWRPQDIIALVRTLKWKDTIIGIGGPCMPDTWIEVLEAQTTQTELRRSPKVMAEFMNMVKKANLSAADGEPFANEFFSPVRSKDKHKEYAKRLAAIQEEPEIVVRLHGRQGGVVPKDILLGRSLKGVVSVLDDIADNGDKILYPDEFFKLTKTINEKIHKLSSKKRSA